MLRVTNFFVVVFVSQLNVIPLLLNKRTKAPEQMGYQLNLSIKTGWKIGKITKLMQRKRHYFIHLVFACIMINEDP